MKQVEAVQTLQFAECECVKIAGVRFLQGRKHELSHESGWISGVIWLAG